MIPTVGRTVLYRHHVLEGAKDETTVSPAIVTVTHGQPNGALENVVDLVVFNRYRVVEFKTGVSLGDGIGQWSWPPRAGETQS